MKSFNFKHRENTKLTRFLYILLRDKLHSGAIESVMENHVELATDIDETIFSNEFIAQYAIDLAKRLTD